MREHQRDTVARKTLYRAPSKANPKPTSFSPVPHPMVGMIGPGGPNPQEYAAQLRGAAGRQLSRVRESLLLQLQRSYGNSYVQRVLASARQGEGNAELAPEVHSAIESGRGGEQAINVDVHRSMPRPAPLEPKCTMCEDAERAGQEPACCTHEVPGEDDDQLDSIGTDCGIPEPDGLDLTEEVALPREVKGTPTPIDAGANSIICSGESLVVQNNNPGPDRSCTDAHESSHIGDWQARYGANLCKGVADGSLPVGGPGYTAFLKSSECKAYRIGKGCRENLLKNAADADKPAIQSGIDRDKTQIGNYCA